jgi:hypothetical protein
MSACNHDAEQEAAQAARWATNWRKLELEALQIARAMRNAEARRHMFFISEAHRLLPNAPSRAQTDWSRPRQNRARQSQILL